MAYLLGDLGLEGLKRGQQLIDFGLRRLSLLLRLQLGRVSLDLLLDRFDLRSEFFLRVLHLLQLCSRPFVSHEIEEQLKSQT